MTHSSSQSFSAENKSILITGCSSGIGYASAIFLAQAGFTVFATVRKPSDHKALLDLHQANLIPIYPLDLSHLDHIPAVISTVTQELTQRGQNGLFALIHNAGGGSVSPIELFAPNAFSLELQTRLVGPIALTQALLPSIRQAHGRIIWISTPAIIPTPYVSSIHASDFAVNCIARTLNIELKPWNIPTVLIRCGGIKTQTGISSTVEVIRMLDQNKDPLVSLYEPALRRWAKDISAFDDKRTEAVEVAKVILKALRAPRPQPRYAVGHMAGLAAVLESIPQVVADAILTQRF